MRMEKRPSICAISRKFAKGAVIERGKRSKKNHPIVHHRTDLEAERFEVHFSK